MKKTSKFLAIVLAVMMIMATMTTTAFAAGTATIKITDTQSGTTYTLYKLLDLESHSGDNYSYKVTAEWKEFFATGAGNTYADVLTGDYISWKAGYTDADAKALAAEAGLVLSGKTPYNATPYAATGDTLTINDLEEGYYLIKSSAGTLFGVATAEIGNTRTIKEKTGLPNINKAVDQATHSIGDEVTFTITLNVETGGTNYIIHDQAEAGFTFQGITSVKYDGTDLTAAEYTLTESGGDFTIAFNDSIAYTSGKAIVVVYKAVLNKDAEIADEVNQNHVWLTHGATNVYKEGNYVDVKTFKFDLVKTKESGEVLDGAKFELYKADGTTPLPVVKVSDGVYRLAVSGETGVEIETVNGVATIQGVGNGTYKLKETAAPAGYNEITSLAEITIADANELAEVTGTTYTSGGVRVINKTGTLLPETGGIGTTIFYVLGGVLVLGAVVLLIARKRRDAEA